MNTEHLTDSTKDELVSGLRRLGAMDPGPDFAARVMDRIDAATTRPGPKRRMARVIGWLMEPRTIRVSPLGSLAAAACLLLALGLFFTNNGGIENGPTPAGLSPVTFVLAAPSAREVAVIGSFNGWKAAGWTMRNDPATGLWTLTTALPSGSHEYVFLVDGTTPVTDAAAALNVNDGFGSRNSVLVVKNGDGTAL